MAQAIFNPATQQLDFVYTAASIAPSDAQYWVATANTTLTAERNLGLLTTGLVKNTVTAGVGVPSTAVDGTDYLSPTYISDTAFAGSWDTDTTHAPSKNAVYDAINPVLASTTANYFFAAPNGVGGAASFRAIVAADIPTLNQNTTGTAANATNIGITDDTSTNATMYPVWVTTNTGNLPAKVSSTKITFNPNTATLTTTTFSGALSGNATTASTLQTARNINGVSFNGSANITINAVMPVTEVTGTTQTAAGDNAYIANNAGLVTITLPTSCTVGQRIKIVGQGAGGWLLAQNASQQIHFIGSNTTSGVGGSLASTVRYDCVEIMCTVTNNEYVVCSSEGNITIV